MSEKFESFDDNEVIDLPSEDIDGAEGDSANDEGSYESFDDDEVKDIDDGVLSDKQTNQLEDDDGSDEKEEEDKEEKKEEPKEEKEDKQEKEDEEPAKKEFKGKPVKIKAPNGETMEVDSEATFKVKVDGKNEIVTLDELRTNYSGKVAWDKKFDDITREKLEVESTLERQTAEREEITGHLSKIAEMLDDPEISPIEALNYLVDMSGRNKLDFNRKVMDFMAPLVRSLDEMDEVERDLYWNKQEIDYIKSNQAAEAEKIEKSKAQREKIESINKLRESHGVDEDQFVKSYRELESLGYKDVTAEQAVEYAVMKPHYETSEQICGQFQDDLGDDELDKLVTEVALTLRKNPSLPHEKVLDIAVSTLGWDIEELEELEELESKTSKREREIKDSDRKYGNQKYEYESFDDFED